MNLFSSDIRQGRVKTTKQFLEIEKLFLIKNEAEVIPMKALLQTRFPKGRKKPIVGISSTAIFYSYLTKLIRYILYQSII
jgi:hypothetical protein